MFEKDISGFAEVIAYFGNGNSATTGPANSVEAEVPFMSIINAVYSPFMDAGLRASRFLKFSSGDSTSATTFGALHGFQTQYYKTAFAPIYKFLDFQEVVAVLVYWMQSLLKIAATTWTTGPSEENIELVRPFNFTARQFAVMVRQSILALFNDTQGACQFLRPSGTTNNFEAFRVGSNAYGKNISQPIYVPSILKENLANLMMGINDVPSKFHNPKNVQIYMPVWGTFVSSDDLNPIATFWDPILLAWVQAPMFLPPQTTTDPNIIDGTTPAGVVVDLNASAIVTELITEWNLRVGALTVFSVTTTPLGGCAGMGALLPYTREVIFTEIDLDSKNSRYAAKRLRNADRVHKKPLSRKNSKERQEYAEEYKLPSGAGIATELTQSVTSVNDITATFKQAMNYLILPILPLDFGVVGPPTQQQYRVATLEAKYMDLNDTVIMESTRNSQLLTFAAKLAPGLAASQNDELNNVVQALSNASKGGFFGDLLGGVLTIGAQALGKAISI
jgi:hypothetical protein